MSQSIKKIIYNVFCLFMFWTIVLVLLVQDKFNVVTSKVFPLCNLFYLAIGGCFIGIIWYINKKYTRKIEEYLEKKTKFLLVITTLALV